MVSIYKRNHKALNNNQSGDFLLRYYKQYIFMTFINIKF